MHMFFMHLFSYHCREPLPGHWNTDLDDFQKLLALKCVRPDRLTDAMQNYVATHLGQRFIEPQTAELGLVFKDSSTTTPLIFVLSPVKNSVFKFQNMYIHC